MPLSWSPGNVLLSSLVWWWDTAVLVLFTRSTPVMSLEGGPPLHLSLPHVEFLVSCGCHSSVGPCSQCGGTVTNEGHDCYGWRLLWTHPSAPESFSPNQIVPYKFAYVCGYLVDLCLSLSASAKRLCHSRLGRWREIGFGQNHFRWYYHLVLFGVNVL